MDKDTELKAGDPCPNCGGEMVPNAAQDPARLGELKKKNSPNPAAAARFADNVKEKADRFGLIYTCTRCGYSARLKDGNGSGAARSGDPARSGDTERSSDAGAGTASDAEDGRAGRLGARGSSSAARGHR